MSARKIGFLILLLAFGAVVETAWRVRENRVLSLGPEGCRVLGGRFYGPSFTFEETVERALPEGEVPRVEVRNEFGDVTVEPGEGPDVQVRLRKVVYLPTEEKARAFAGRIELRAETRGGRLRVRTNRDELERGPEVGFETHLELHVPPETEIEVRGGHGAVALRGLARATVRASFGDVQVEEFAGPVNIEARQGAVRARDLRSGLTLDARHGDVEVHRVAGPAELKVEHGAVTARETAGLRAKVSFGDLTAENVAGDLIVVSSHGGITATDVKGRAEAETSFADVRLTAVGGDARAKTRDGAVVASGIGGALAVEATNAGVELERVDGHVEVSVENGGVEARSIRKGARIRATGGDASIDGFDGSVDVAVERASVRLTTGTPITEALTATATGGEVRLEVPDGSRFALEAESLHGDLHLDLPGAEELAPGPEGRSRATATVGGGGARVKLTADGDVTTVSRPPATTPEAP